MKKTKVMLFNEVLAMVQGNGELTDFVQNEINLLNKKAERAKATSKTRSTKKQVENEQITEQIYNVLCEKDVPFTIEQINNAMGTDYSSQKISALLRTLVNTEKVSKLKVKGKTVYKAEIPESVTVTVSDDLC